VLLLLLLLWQCVLLLLLPSKHQYAILAPCGLLLVHCPAAATVVCWHLHSLPVLDQVVHLQARAQQDTAHHVRPHARKHKCCVTCRAVAALKTCGSSVLTQTSIGSTWCCCATAMPPLLSLHFRNSATQAQNFCLVACCTSSTSIIRLA
jgi:hypothetical protein